MVLFIKYLHATFLHFNTKTPSLLKDDSSLLYDILTGDLQCEYSIRKDHASKICFILTYFYLILIEIFMGQCYRNIYITPIMIYLMKIYNDI